MNDLQKKSLIFTIIIGVIYYFLIGSTSFNIPFILLIISVLAICTYFFNFKFKKDELSKIKFLIFPLLFNIGSALYIFALFQPIVKYVFTLIVIILNFYLFVALKRVQNLEERAAVFQRNILVSIAFLTLFLTNTAIFRFYVLLSTSKVWNFPVSLVILLISSTYFLISYFLGWENGLNLKKFLPYNLVGTLLSAEVALVSVIWIVNYPVFVNVERASLGGIPISAVLLTIIFYLIWGITSHKMDKSLTRRVMTEYVIISIVFLIILLSTAKWLPLT